MTDVEYSNSVMSQQSAEPEIYEFPCSLAQNRFWVLEQINPENAALNVAVRWRLKGRLDAPRLQEALNAVIERHEILRTAYREIDGEPVQLVMPEACLQLPVIDLTLLPEPARLDEQERISRIEARKTFDLTTVPSLRATLLKVGADEHVILVTVHHIASDGWSIGVIAHDMMEFYEASLKSRIPALTELPLQYGDFAVWQQEWLKADALKGERAYWTTQLDGFKRFELPSDRPHDGSGVAPAMIIGRQLPRELTDGLAAYATSQGCTFFMIGASALMAVLHRRTGARDITIGTQIAGRDRVELNNVIGPFINTVPLRARLAEGLRYQDLLVHMQEVIEGALTHQRMPIEDIVTIVRPVREPGRDPLFSVNLICQRSFIPTDERPDLTLVDMPSVSPGALYDLNFFFVERPTGWRMSCEYNAALYSEATVNRYLDDLNEQLGTFLANPDRQLASVPALATKSGQGDQSAKSAGPATTHVGVEAQLAEIWVEVLKVPILNRLDNFFTLGGHSLSAFRMLSRVEKTFKQRVSFEQLHANPTIEALAALLAPPADDTLPAAAETHAVVMQPRGEGIPVFAIQDTFIFQELANGLAPQHPFLAVPLPPIVKGEPAMSLEDYVEYNVRAIEEAHPKGPYILVGFCAAAQIGVDIARRLIERGHEIELFVTLDAWAPGYTAGLSRSRRLLNKLSYQGQTALSYLFGLFGGAEARRHSLRRIRLHFEILFKKAGLAEEDVKEEEWARSQTWLAETRSRKAAQPLPMPILVVHNEHMPLSFFLDRSMGWNKITSKRAIMAPVRGTHEELIRRTSSRTIAGLIASYAVDRRDA